MCSNQISAVKQQLDFVLRFLETHLSFANCHMVDYFTKNLYGHYVPKEIQNEISLLGYKETINLIMNRPDGLNAPKLTNFIKSANNCALYNLKEVCLQNADLQKILLEMGVNCIPSVNLKVFASPKKSHEVEILSSIAATLKHISNSTHVIDVGDGKGYLSSMLALQHSIPVLGIDSSPTNTKGANKRAGNLQKAWKNIMKFPTKSLPAKCEDNFTDNQLYKQVTLYVDEEVDLKDLVSTVFEEKCDQCGLTGLHTCGDLSPTSIRIYNKHAYIKTLCNVGCCYHLLTESNGFPMSDYLKTKNFTLGRQARMLASQSVDRILSNKQTENKSIFYRAIFQVLIEKHQPHLAGSQTGRLKKDCNTFLDYVRFAAKRINAAFDLSEQQIYDVFLEFESREVELNVFYLLRAFLAQVVESVILLDRLLFLLEQGYSGSYLVQLFNRVLSPRCYGLISVKDF